MKPDRALLRVLSYNIHKGFALGNRSFILKNIKEAIRKSGADLVFLQEVLGEHRHHASRVKDWPSGSQFEFLADEVWSHYAYGKNAVYDAGHHGNAILCKFPIVEFSNINISSMPFENRGLLHAVIQIPKRGILAHCLCVHLGLLQRARKIQLEKIWRKIASEIKPNEPLIVAGDFNDWSERATTFLAKKIGLREAFHEFHGKHPRTFPSKFPILKLDRIYFRKVDLHEAKVLKGRPWTKLSDHSALYAEFKL